jgi:hypothetical protein
MWKGDSMMVRFRWARISVAAAALVSAFTAIGASAAVPPAGAATAAPACTFNGVSLPLVLSASAGEKVALDCTGLSAAHPYLVMEVSVLLGIDPKAAPLLDGNITSLAGLMALLDALPEVNPAALAFPLTDLSGNLNYTYTLPTSQAPDPNATCPPSNAELNMGLIGCALAMIDLTTFKVVGAGSALINYKGQPLLPPSPTLALSAKTAKPSQVVDVSDAPGATTYWWLSTLTGLEGLLGEGSAAPPKVQVTLQKSKNSRPTKAANKITVTPAVYNYPTLTPPKISGGFTVPAISGDEIVTVTYTAPLLGSTFYNVASAPTRLNVK